jgi:hypothetical protein
LTKETSPRLQILYDIFVKNAANLSFFCTM